MSDDAYKDACARIDALMDAKPGTPEGAELDLLARLIELIQAQDDKIEALRGSDT